MKHPGTASRPHVSHALRAPCLRPVTPRIAVRMSLEAKPSSEPFDRSVFTRVLTVPALRVPKARCSEVLHKFRG